MIYRYGGVYLDSDIIVLKSLYLLEASVGVEDQMTGDSNLNGAVMSFKRHRLHRQLVNDFFRNACHMLRPFGEVHVTHKTESPYNKWKIEELAFDNSLMLIECAAFNINDYPGYNNKRGDGVNCDQPFRLGECCTYKFAIGDMHGKKASQKMKAAISHMNAVNVTSEDGSWYATEINHFFEIRYRQPDFMRKMAVRTQNTFVEPFDAEHIPSTGVKATSRWISGVPQTNFDTPVVGIQSKLYSPPWYGISNLSSRALGHVAELRDTVRKFGPDFRLSEGFMPDVYEPRMGNHIAELRDTVRKFGPDFRLPEGFMPDVYEPRMGVRDGSDGIRGDIIARYGPDTRNGYGPDGSYEPCRSVH